VKRVWVKVVPWRKELAIAALESGADAVVVPEKCSAKVKELGLMRTVAEDGDIKPGRDVVFFEIKDKSDEEKAARMPADTTLVLSMKDWTIIPLENILAQRGNIMVEVSSADQARTALETLEKGADGVMLNTGDVSEIKKTVNMVHASLPQVELRTAEVTSTAVVGMGDRVCVDTCSNMVPGEGMLIGNASSGFFLVQAECTENPYVETRPFRVNAGPIHAYLLAPGGKTKYLSELKVGEEVMVVNQGGEARPAYIGRCKIERRPLMLIKAAVEGQEISTMVQNAETIRLVQPGGDSISVASVKPGTKLLVHVTEAGRHFGMKIDETIEEK
jgi:3-dehydroquinate synthase II